MKPIFLSQVLIHKYWNVLSFVSITFGVLTLISQCTPEFEETAELIIGILAVVALLVGFIFVFVRYNTKKSLEIMSTELKMLREHILEENKEKSEIPGCKERLSPTFLKYVLLYNKNKTPYI